jgi:hypothetical protein
MQITETERLMLIKKKEEICGATLQIHRLESDPKNSLTIKENIQIILSLLSSIGSYADIKNKELSEVCNMAIRIQDRINNHHWLLAKKYEKNEQSSTARGLLSEMDIEGQWNLRIKDLEYFCSVVNSIDFKFQEKKGLKIILPKNINFGNITNQ